MNNWSTERLAITANAQNTLQYFQGRASALPPCPTHEEKRSRHVLTCGQRVLFETETKQSAATCGIPHYIPRSHSL